LPVKLFYAEQQYTPVELLSLAGFEFSKRDNNPKQDNNPYYLPLSMMILKGRVIKLVDINQRISQNKLHAINATATQTVTDFRSIVI